MIKSIQAKVMLSHVKQPDAWFGLKYNMNLYRGCQHQCIYCDSRSRCYQIEDFSNILVKENAIELLENELARKRVKGTIGTGSMNDPYMPVEAKTLLTRRALEVIARFRFPVHVITKSDLVLRDLDLLQQINEVYSAVSFTITTTDDQLARKLEPGAPPPSARLRAMKVLAENGILTGVTMMPILPFIEDDEENISQIVTQANEHGASYILSGFGMTLRDRQRAYYYNKLDRHFPGLRQQYERQFGDQYYAPANNFEQLKTVFEKLCDRYGMAVRLRPYIREEARQLRLF
ncbi:MAG: radical SAM protein [Chloroflexota bacterium]|nr:MAG: radical SAM protein [Chloroflexota bacterium]